MSEQWQPIQNFSKYLVSDLGRVRNRQTQKDVPLLPSSRHIPMVSLVNNQGQVVTRKLVRLVCDSFLYDPDGYSAVAHIDGDKTNCRLSNLTKLGDPDKKIPGRRSKKAKEIVLVRRGSLYIGLEDYEKEQKTLVEPPEPRPIVPTKRVKHNVGAAVVVNETGEVYASLTAAARQLNLDASSISKMLRGVGTQTSYKGYSFRYAKDQGRVPPEIEPPHVPHARKYREVYCVTNEKSYKSQSDAARELNLSQPAISKVLLGRMSNTQGFVFEYRDTEK